MTGIREARAAFERGGRVVLVAPPAPARAGMVWDLLPPAETAAPAAVVLCADQGTALDWAAAAPTGRTVHPVTALERSARLLQAGAVDVLAGSLPDLVALVRRSALKLAAVPTLVLAWPEGYPADAGALDALLADAREARRIVLSWNPPQLAEFLERTAFRAPVIGRIPLDDTARALPPVGPARYAVATPDARAATIRAVIDALDPHQPVVWRAGADPAGGSGDLVICADLPTRDELVGLLARGPVLLVITPAQLPYARSLAAPLTAVRASVAADQAGERAAALRNQVAARLAAGPVDAELLLLEPLFARHDPAEVAAALLALGRAQEAPVGEPDRGAASDNAARVKIFVNVGKKDRVGAKDLVGALINEAGLKKTDIGRIELRETFSTVEIATPAVDSAVRGLSGTSIRGRRVQARKDRDA